MAGNWARSTILRFGCFGNGSTPKMWGEEIPFSISLLVSFSADFEPKNKTKMLVKLFKIVAKNEHVFGHVFANFKPPFCGTECLKISKDCILK